MNIKNRIKKLESGIDDDKPFCDCLMQYFRGIIDAVYDNTQFDDTAFPLPEGDYCNKCCKPVRVSFEQGLIEDINVAYDALAIQ